MVFIVKLNEKFLIDIAQPRYQFIFLILTVIIAVSLAYKPVTEFHSLDPRPQLIPITPLKIKEWGGGSAYVNVGLYILNFPEFDIVHNKFVLDGIIWFEFDPSLISLETVSKFSFEKGEILSKSAPFTKIIDDKFFARYNIRLRFSTDLMYMFFPFDDHRLYIVLINQFVSPSEMIFQAYEADFFLSERIYTAGWSEIKKTVRSGYAEAQLDKFDVRKKVRFPKVIFSIDYKQVGIRHILLIMIPLFLIFFMGLFSLALDPKEHSGKILTLASASLTTLLAYRFVIENMTPPVDYFVLSDQIFTFFLVVTLAEFAFAIYVIRALTLSKFALLLRGILFLLAHVSLWIYWYYLLSPLL